MNQIIYLNEKKSQLIFNNFKYQYDVKPRASCSRYYRCIEKSNPNFKCTATESILNEEVQPYKDHNHTPMFECECEYHVEFSKLKEICSSFTMIETKHRYEQIHHKLDMKYGRQILSPHWRSWSSVRTTFNKILAKNQCSTTAKDARNI